MSGGETAWNPESGHTHLDFAVSDLASRAAPIARRTAQAARAAEGDLDAEDWYALGLELEALAPGPGMEGAAGYRPLPDVGMRMPSCQTVFELLAETTHCFPLNLFEPAPFPGWHINDTALLEGLQEG